MNRWRRTRRRKSLKVCRRPTATPCFDAATMPWAGRAHKKGQQSCLLSLSAKQCPGHCAKHSRMNCWRASPFKGCACASTVQDLFFSFCAIRASSGALAVSLPTVAVTLPPERQLCMNALRSLPFRRFAVASALQSVIRCCCASCFSLNCLAGLGAAASSANVDAAMAVGSKALKKIARTVSISLLHKGKCWRSLKFGHSHASGQ